MRPLVLAACALALLCGTTAAASEPHGGVHWTYSGDHGPRRWASLSPEFAACAAGLQQSPVNLTGARTGDLPPLELAYQPAKVAIADNGHTLQQSFDGASTLTMGGETWTLVQLHFHHRSEHTVDGKRFPMEAHFVHRSAAGRLAVVAVLFVAGEANPGLARLWTRSSTLTFDPNTLLPEDRTYFAYSGSLTTPPCTEGVSWRVLRHPVTASAAQLASFARLFPDNARPVMPINQREVQAGSAP